MKRAAEVEEKRNQIMRSIRGAGNDANTITRIKTTAKKKHGLRFQFEDVTAEYLRAFANDIKILVEAIQNLFMALDQKGKVGFLRQQQQTG